MTLPRPTYRLRTSGDAVVLTLPIPTVSESNARGHWSKRHARSAPQRRIVGLVLRPQLSALGLPVRVLLTRMSAGELDDDNLRGALKAVRDGVADALGLRDDSDARVTWLYAQAKVPRGSWGFEVVVTRSIAVERVTREAVHVERERVEVPVVLEDR